MDNAERAEKIYLFERDEKWIEALEKTFEPWHGKIGIINKYVSDINNDSNVTLDKFFANSRLNVVKADIEGMEIKLLEGGRELIKREGSLKLLLCAYHGKNDAETLKNMLENNGYKTQYSKGYMLYIYDQKFEEPFIRRGIIFAKK